MNILDLAQELNLLPKRSSLTNGGEYKSKCPKCQEGTDRFCIWPNQGSAGRYWCRVCETKGDGIQFCRDFLGLTFHQACQKVNVAPELKVLPPRAKKILFEPRQASMVHLSWQQVAKRFIDYAHENLLKDPSVITQLEQRGLSFETVKRFRLGWNPKALFDQRERWGLAPEIKEKGVPRRQWLPKGIVIPSFQDSYPTKIKIRRSDWVIEDALPKYVEISGSTQSPSLYGDLSKPAIIVESELDAILIQQEAADLVCSVALGGVSKKPDAQLHEWLKQASVILLSLDFDEPGKNRYSFWMQQYPNLRPWPSPACKSPGDAAQLACMNILKWVRAGLFTA